MLFFYHCANHPSPPRRTVLSGYGGSFYAVISQEESGRPTQEGAGCS